jgi:glycine betaine transporter
VFGWSFAVVAAFSIAGALWPDAIGDYANAALTWIVDNVGWLFVVAAAGFVLFSLYLAFSRYGRIRLSEHDEGPEFSTVSWVAMMFSAGMGVGLIFFGVYEPLAHMSNPAPWLDVRPGTQ